MKKTISLFMLAAGLATFTYAQKDDMKDAANSTGDAAKKAGKKAKKGTKKAANKTGDAASDMKDKMK